MIGWRTKVPGVSMKTSIGPQVAPLSLEIRRMTTAESWLPAFCEVQNSHKAPFGARNNTGFCSERVESSESFPKVRPALAARGKPCGVDRDVGHAFLRAGEPDAEQIAIG